jgi:type IV pilus assembly protein PilY1
VIIMKKRYILTILTIVAVTFSGIPGHLLSAQAQTPQPDYYEAYPPFLSASVPPLVMLVMGRNHKLYYEAYNDASDLDGDGSLDTTYKPDDIDYYGYFDSFKYYRYANNRFEPVGFTAADKKAPSGAYWSGDFLNYVSMTRMDAMRKVLYGGYRSTDDNGLTVLERVFVPQDAHSWGKEYENTERDGYDIADYTPLSQPQGASRHLLASTTLSDGGAPQLRVLQNSVLRIWEWVAIERPVAGNDGNDGTGRRSILDNNVGASAEVDVTDGGGGGNVSDSAAAGQTTITDDFENGSIDAMWQWQDHDTNSGTNSWETGGELVIDAGGADVWTGADEFAVRYLNDVDGNFDIKVRVDYQENRNNWGKCGIMVRNDMTADGSSTGYVIMATTPGNGHTFQYDNNNNGYLDSHITNTSVSYPSWVRLQKVGTTFVGYRSTDGVTWTVHATRTIASAATVQDVGLFVTSHNDGTLSQCRFEEVEITQSLGTDPSLAFDDQTATNWTVVDEPSGADPLWLQFSFFQPRRILKYNFTTSDEHEDRDPKAWVLLATNDATVAASTVTDVDDWVIIDKVTNGDLPAARNTQKSFECVNPPAEGTTYQYYRYVIAESKDDDTAGISLAEIEMFETLEQIPANATLDDYNVRIQVCVAGLLESNSKLYPNGNYKPIGLLQRHGESGNMLFGLMSGSYSKNTSGGVLRKRVGSITDEIEANTGRYTAVNGIIKTIDKLRVVDFDYGSHSYSANCGWIATRAIAEGECRMWGNPIGEMMYESLRYFAGEGSSTGAFDYGNGNDNVGGTELTLPVASWNDPFDTSDDGYDYCSKPFMLVLSDIYPTYDSDQLPGSAFSGQAAASIGNAATDLDVEALADDIFVAEESAGNRFIGQQDTTADGACTEKYVDGFGDLRGLCPEEPTKQGSYYAASVAWYGRTEDLHTADTNQNVRTYAVGLASPLPKIDILLQGQTITLVPFAKSVGGFSISATEGDYQPTNTIVDFFVEELRPTFGRFRINYEDVEQGADHDMDAIVTYEYQLVDNNGFPVNNIADATALDISLFSDYAAGSIIQHMGYVISGTTTDGTYLEVRDADTATGSDPDYFLDTPPGVWATDATPAWNDSDWLPLNTTRRFVVDPGGGTLAAGLLENPLWFAAKYGGFDDQDADGVPDGDEWDKDGDGVPDTYYYVVNPLKLEQQLNKSFADILEKAASGTAASVLATNSEGEGNLMQAYFQPKQTTLSSELTWVGFLQSLWVDPCGNLREDSDGDLQLDKQNTNTGNTAVQADKIIEFITDANGDTKIIRYTAHYLYNPDNEDNCTCILDELDPVQACSITTEELAIDQIYPLFESGELLSQRDPATRNIFTFLDGDGDDNDGDGTIDESNESEAFKSVGQVLNPAPGITGDDPFDDSDELLRFHTDNLARLKPFLGVNDASCSECDTYLNTADDDTRASVLINFIRGYDQADIAGYTADGLRPRTLDNGNVWKLGDIVNSTPVSVSRAPDNFHIIYGDETFQTYFDDVRNRETVVYVGANDGMLHAFTSWHYDSENGLYDDPETTDGPGDSGYIPGERIGDELWAYIPQTLLPHLKWLADPEYNHAYYVDLKPKIFDAKIDVRGNGTPEWRTLLICGLNLGGKHIWVNEDFDGNAGNELRHFYPSYFCLDITVPRAPRVLWERSFEGMGMSTSSPAVVKVGDSWFAVVGSGPNDDDGTDDIISGQSDQNGHVYVLDILTGEPYNDGVNDWLFETGESNAYMNSPSSIDYGLNNNVDGIYLASSYQDGGGVWRGNVHKINTWNSGSPSTVPSNWSSDILYDGSDGGPITPGISLSVDSQGNVWTYFGTGRYLSFADKIDEEQQYFFGMKDPFFNLAHDQGAPNDFYLNDANTRTLDKNDLFDSNGYTITTSRNVYTGSCPPTCNPFGANGTWEEFVTEVRTWDGWFIDLQTSAGLPSERVVSKASVLGGIVFFPGYIPNDDVCGFGGDSGFYGLYFETGTAFPKIVLPGGSVGPSMIDGESQTVVGTRIDLGSGAPPPATGFHVGQQEGAKAFLQMSTGQVIELDVETAFRLKSGLTFWRERSN